MHAPPAHADPLLQQVLTACVHTLTELGGDMDRWLALLDAGSNVAKLTGLSKQECDAVYSAARLLYDERDHERALPIAVCAVTCDPADTRYAYLAGMCLKKRGHTEAAAAMFDLSLASDGANAAAALRLGQCAELLGDAVCARRSYEHAIDAARADESLRRVQDVALELLARLH